MLARIGLLILGCLLLIGGLFWLNATVFVPPVASLPEITFAVDPEYPALVSKTTVDDARRVRLPVFEDPVLNNLIETDYAVIDNPQTNYEVLSLSDSHASFRFNTPADSFVRTYTRDKPARLRLENLASAQTWQLTWPAFGSMPTAEYFGYQNRTLLVPTQANRTLTIPLESVRSGLKLEALQLLAPDLAQAEAVAREQGELAATLQRRVQSEQAALTTSTDCRALTCVALTFDDGPGPYTETLLETLRDKNVPATFYVLGQQVAEYPETLKRIVADGHTVGNHTYHHPDLTTLEDDEAFLEISRTQDLIYELTGRYPLTYRPPFGARREIPDYPLDQVLWNRDPLDWEVRNSEVVAKRAIENLEPGSIILLHDIYPETVAAVPAIIDTLQARGFVFVTVEDLLTDEAYVPQRRVILKQEIT